MWASSLDAVVVAVAEVAVAAVAVAGRLGRLRAVFLVFVAGVLLRGELPVPLALLLPAV